MFGACAKAFSPSGISSFFEICDRDANGTPIDDPARIGAKGGGFALAKGVTTEVCIEPSDATRVEVVINGRPVDARTTNAVISLALHPSRRRFHILVEHNVDVPIGAGFGTSAAGAFSCGLALSHALRLDLTYNQIAKLAHVADVISDTGLGTVEGLAVGGLVLILNSGACRFSQVDRIPLPSNLRIVAGSFRPIDKRSVIMPIERRRIINTLATKAMGKILGRPTLENFFTCSKEFALQSGLASDRVVQLITDAEDAGALGATQNMIGEAVHAATVEENLVDVVDAFKEHLPDEHLVVSPIDFRGARLLE
jgi:pantoate kinase